MDVRELHRRHRRRTRVRYRLLRHNNGLPRLSVHRSHRHMYAQIIDDAKGETLVAASTLEKDVRSALAQGSNKEAASHIGTLIAQRAVEKNITKVIFDRGLYRYHGRVRALAEASRAAGLQC